MKIQVLICKTCNTPFAACVEDYVDDKWFRSCASYMKGGNTRLETNNGFDFSAKLNTCCGRTNKQIEKQKERDAAKALKESTKQLKINL